FQIPKCLNIRTVTNGLTQFSEVQKLDDSFRFAAHALIWTPWEGHSNFGNYKAAILMHLRFDGTIGFPGGLIDKGENLIDGLAREMSEEINWKPEYHTITWDDYYSTHVDKRSKLILNFFVIKISMENFKKMEIDSLLAQEYGKEVFGNLRVPLYTMDNQYNGFPAFLNNKFVGNAKQQLLLGIIHKNILTEEEVEEAIFKSQNMKLAPNRF
ncbi:unnamed protein product, partial [Meganyctiphanes norvegica]